MRVGIFTNSYTPTVNGVVNSILGFKKGLEALGHEVFVVCADAPGKPENEERVFRLKALPKLRNADLWPPTPFPRRVWRALRDLQLDIVHTQHPLWLGRWALWFARRHGIPAITTIHTQYDEYCHYVPVLGRVSRRFVRRTVARYCNWCDCVTTPAETMRQKLREWGVTQRIDVVPNATDLAPFLSADGSPVRRQYGIGDDDVLLLWAGRLAPEKNIPFLIESVGLINESAPNTKLMIVGSGPDAEALRRLAVDRGLSDCVILTGHVPYASIPPYYAAADIFVSASVTEVQPLVITEAMAAHTPVVAVQAQGSVDAIRHGENGLLFRNRDQDGLRGAEDLLPCWLVPLTMPSSLFLGLDRDGVNRPLDLLLAMALLADVATACGCNARHAHSFSSSSLSCEEFSAR